MMRGLMPWMGLGKHEVDRLLAQLVEMKWDSPLSQCDWVPSIDISETKDSLIARIEVPGMEQRDIQISLQESLLTIKGEKKQEMQDKEERYHRVERCYGAFTRNVRLPVAVEPSRVSATVKNGVLTVRLLKTPASKDVTIPIRVE